MLVFVAGAKIIFRYDSVAYSISEKMDFVLRKLLSLTLNYCSVFLFYF